MTTRPSPESPPDIGGIAAEERAVQASVSWLGTGVYCALAFPFFLYALATRNFVAILVTGFFAAFGVLYIVITARVVRGVDRYGDVRLRLEGEPLRPGGRLLARLLLPHGPAGLVAVDATLMCSALTRDALNRETLTPIWAARGHFPVRSRGGRAEAEIALELPENQRPTGTTFAGPSGEADAPAMAEAVWHVEVAADSPAAKFVRRYPVVVGLPARYSVPALYAPPKALDPRARPAARDRSSVWALIAANLLPIPAAMLWGWQVHDFLFLYWIENVIVGAMNVLRIMVAVPDTLVPMQRGGIAYAPYEILLGKAVLIAFFALHYGGLTWVYGEAIATFFRSHPAGALHGIAGSLHELFLQPAGTLAVLGIFASHAYGFTRHYVAGGEYLNADVRMLMVRPYLRIGLTHLYLICGAIVLGSENTSWIGITLFVAVKIAFDLLSDARERAAFAAPRR